MLPHIKEVRGQGLLVGVEFDETVNAIDVKHKCFDKKLLITAIGSSVIRMVPPLILTKSIATKQQRSSGKPWKNLLHKSGSRMEERGCR